MLQSVHPTHYGKSHRVRYCPFPGCFEVTSNRSRHLQKVHLVLPKDIKKLTVLSVPYYPRRFSEDAQNHEEETIGLINPEDKPRIKLLLREKLAGFSDLLDNIEGNLSRFGQYSKVCIRNIHCLLMVWLNVLIWLNILMSSWNYL